MKAQITKTLSSGEIVTLEQEVGENNIVLYYTYQGYDIYNKEYFYEGEKYYFYIWNSETKDEIFGFNDLEECVTYIMDKSKI